jgi:hypothetical protein
MVQSEGNMSLKNPVTPPGIDPRTVRLAVQSLNHYATPGPMHINYIYKIPNILTFRCIKEYRTLSLPQPFPNFSF